MPAYSRAFHAMRSTKNRKRRGIFMYRFVTDAFGKCSVRRRKHCSAVPTTIEIIEIAIFHGFSRIVSTYRHERQGPLCGNQSEVGLCRHAVAQFLQRNEPFHLARVEILDLTLPKFKGKLTSISEGRHSGERYSECHHKFNPGPRM